MVRKDELWSRIDQLEAEKEFFRKQAEANLVRVDVYRDLYENLLREFTGRTTAIVSNEAVKQERPTLSLTNKSSKGFYSRLANG